MKKIALLLLLALSFSVSLAGMVNSQTPVAGVASGDKFSYRYTLTGTHNRSLSWDPWMPELNQSIWEITVTSVNGSRINYQLQINLENGTVETSPSLYIDLFSGGSNGVNYLFFVGSNLNVGSAAFPGGVDLVVNDSITSNYPSGSRLTNHISFTSLLDFRNALNDKVTGVLVEFTATYSDLAGTFKLSLTYSSLWTASPSPTPTPSTTPTTTIIPTPKPTTNPSATPTTTPAATPTSTLTPSTSPTINPTSTPISTQPSPTVPEFSSTVILYGAVIAGLCSVATLLKKTNFTRERP
jgi:hypothetical protein